jgi:GT2 family glycosyltransferase
MKIDNLPLASIIVLNFNGEKYISQCVKSILKSDYNNFELIIVDNNSSDHSIEIIEQEYNDNRIKIIKSEKNLGFAGGNNLGAEHAKGKYFVFLNIDTIVDSQWLSELVSVMESDNTIGAAQPKLLSLDDKTIFDSAGDYLDFFGNSFRRGGDWLEKDNGQYDNVREIFSARGAALITRKEIVEKIGLFDDDYFLDFEDIDFCWRVRLFGFRIVFVPTAIVYHKGGGISSANPTVKSIHPSKNRFTTMIKNYDTTNMINYAILPFLLNFFTGLPLIEALIKGKKDLFKIRIKTSFWIFCNIGKLRTKRKIVQHNVRKVPDSEIMKNMIKSSRWQLKIYVFNIYRYGPAKARMYYFNKGFRTTASERENTS